MSESAFPSQVWTPPAPDRERSNAARFSVGVATGLIVLKLGVAVLTGSIAVVASALDSMLDLFASLVNWVVIRTAEAPPDREHPYGHGKAESLGGLVQSLVIGLSGLYVLLEAGNRLRTPVPVRYTVAGVAVMAVGMVASAWVVARLRRVARQTDSPALWADSMHYLTDVYTNGGALLALLVVRFTGSPLPDTVTGFAIAALVLWSAFQVLTQAVNGLMDRRLPDETVTRIRDLLLAHPDVIALHDLRARQSGADKFVQVHVEMNGRMSFEAAHNVAEALTNELEQLLQRASVIVHADPVELNERGEVVARPPSEPPAVVPQE